MPLAARRLFLIKRSLLQRSKTSFLSSAAPNSSDKETISTAATVVDLTLPKPDSTGSRRSRVLSLLKKKLNSSFETVRLEKQILSQEDGAKFSVAKEVFQPLQQHASLQSMMLGDCSMDDATLLSFRDILLLGKLRHLWMYQGTLNDNRIETLFGEHTPRHLQTLILFENELTDMAAPTLQKLIQNNSELEVLDLARNRFTAVGMAQLAEAFRDHKDSKMKQLMLDDIASGTEGSMAWSRVIGKMKNLLRLQWRNGQWSADGTAAVCRAVQEAGSIERLALSGQNAVGTAGAVAVASLIQTTPSLERLELSHCNQLEGTEFATIANALEGNESLLFLFVNENPIGDGGMESIAEVLNKSALNTFQARRCRVGETSARAFAKALERNEKLTHLTLSRNEIGDEGAIAIAESLAANLTLRQLDLSANRIGDRGIEALAEALKTNRSIRKVGLGANNFSVHGMRALADALAVNKSILYMDVNYCRSGDDGAFAIAEALKANSTLKRLHMKYNLVTSVGARALVDICQQNSSLYDLSLHELHLPMEETIKLKKILTKRKRTRDIQ